MAEAVHVSQQCAPMVPPIMKTYETTVFHCTIPLPRFSQAFAVIRPAPRPRSPGRQAGDDQRGTHFFSGPLPSFEIIPRKVCPCPGCAPPTASFQRPGSTACVWS